MKTTKSDWTQKKTCAPNSPSNTTFSS